MGRLVRVAAAAELQPGQGKTVEAEGVEIALFNVDGTYHAIANACYHHGGPLGEGELEGTTVTCPWHGWQFDVTSGSTYRNPEIGVSSYRVEVQGGDLYVEMP
jgi:nitrite reductase (NADH) small subunit